MLAAWLGRCTRVLRVPLASQSLLTSAQFRCCNLPHSLLLSTSQPVAVRGRNRIVAGASNPQDLSQEAMALVKEAHDPDDLSWQPGLGIGQPITLDVSTEERNRALQYEVTYNTFIKMVLCSRNLIVCHQVPYKGYSANVDNGGEVRTFWILSDLVEL